MSNDYGSKVEMFKYKGFNFVEMELTVFEELKRMMNDFIENNKISTMDYIQEIKVWHTDVSVQGYWKLTKM